MTIYYTLRSPSPKEKRAGFAVLRVERNGNKKTVKTIKTPEIKTLNEQFLKNTYSFSEAKAMAQSIREKLNIQENGVKEKPLTLAENQALLNKYWDEDYAFRDVIDQDSMWNSMQRALVVIGTTPLQTAQPNELYKKISNSDLGNNKKRRVISRLNQLLKFAGRNFALKLPKQDFFEVKYLNAEQVRKVANKLSAQDKDLVMIGFSTGARLGEIFAMAPESIKNKYFVHINSQIRRDNKKALPKNRKTRTVRVLELGIPPLLRWVKDTSRQRNKNISAILKNACKEIWPKDKSKHITFHDLRHSFAIEMLRQGESLTTVANLLGDSIAVCQMYYTGFSMADESLDALHERLKRAKK